MLRADALSLCGMRKGGENQRGTASILNSLGEWVKPNTPSRLGISPGTGDKVKRWRRAVKKRNSSILARFSPRHTRLPATVDSSFRSGDS